VLLQSVIRTSLIKTDIILGAAGKSTCQTERKKRGKVATAQTNHSNGFGEQEETAKASDIELCFTYHNGLHTGISPVEKNVDARCLRKRYITDEIF